MYSIYLKNGYYCIRKDMNGKYPCLGTVNRAVEKYKKGTLKMTHTINLYGGPGTGKSTTASHLFASMKLDDINCELVREYAKDKVWENSLSTLDDQLYVFAKQYHRQFILIDNVEYIISDSPLLLSLIYGRNKTNKFKELVLEMFNSFNNTNIFLVRTKQYQQAGRYTSEDRALDIDEEILEILTEYDIPYIKVLANKDAYKTIRRVLNV